MRRVLGTRAAGAGRCPFGHAEGLGGGRGGRRGRGPLACGERCSFVLAESLGYARGGRRVLLLRACGESWVRARRASRAAPSCMLGSARECDDRGGRAGERAAVEVAVERLELEARAREQ